MEIVKKRKVVKMRRTQIEIMNCALGKRCVEFEGLRILLMDFNEEMLVFLLVFLVVIVLDSSGKNMKKNPIAVNPIVFFFSHTYTHSGELVF